METVEVSRARVILSQVVACSALCVLLIDLGLSVCFVTTVLPVLLDAKEGLSLNQEQASWFGSIVFLCQPTGTIFSGPLLDRVGRKGALLLVNIPHILAWLLMYLAWNVPTLFAANALLGFGTGLMEAPSVTYVGEISEPSIRGSLTILTSLFTSFGVLSAFLLGTLLPWRTAALVCLAVPILAALLACLVPETPIWLLSRGRRTEAQVSLQRVRGWTSSPQVLREIDQLVRYSEATGRCAVCLQNETPPEDTCPHQNLILPKRILLNVRHVLLAKETFRPFQLVVAYFAIHATCGLGPIRSNMINVTKALGMQEDASQIVIIVGVLSILMAAVSAAVVKLVGKRVLVLAATAGCALCYAALAAYARIHLSNEVSSYSPASFPHHRSRTPLVLFYLLVCCSQLGIPWVFLSEVFPFRSRAMASSLAAAACYFITFVGSKTNLDLESKLHISGAFALYAAVGVVGLVYLYIRLPETEGVSLDDIERLYASGKSNFRNDNYFRMSRDKREVERMIL